MSTPAGVIAEGIIIIIIDVLTSKFRPIKANLLID
jgi:hypothetical protein